MQTPHALALNRCLAMARGQFQLVTLDQALAAGMTRRAIEWRLSSRRWHTMFPKVYRVGRHPDPRLQELKAVELWIPDSVFSHRSAAVLWDLDGVKQNLIEISTTTCHRRAGVAIHRVESLRPLDTCIHRGLRVTTPTDSLIGLAAVQDALGLESALDSALRQSLTHVPLLEKRLGMIGGSGRHGTRKLWVLVMERRRGLSPNETPLEILVGDLLRRNGIEPSARQHWLRRLTFVEPSPTRIV